MTIRPSLPFVRPRTYFREYGPGLPLVPALVTVLLVALAITASFAGAGWLMMTNIAEDATVEKPDRPPEQFCEGTEPGDPFYDDCHPERVPMDDALWTAITDELPLVFATVLLLWVGLAAVLYLLPAWLGDPDGPPHDAFAVAAWAMVPFVGQSIAGVAAVAWFLRDRTLSGDAATLESQIGMLVGILEGPVFLAVTGFIVGWQGYIVYQGLNEGRGMAASTAGGVAAFFSLVLFSLQLA